MKQNPSSAGGARVEPTKNEALETLRSAYNALSAFGLTKKYPLLLDICEHMRIKVEELDSLGATPLAPGTKGDSADATTPTTRYVPNQETGLAPWPNNFEGKETVELMAKGWAKFDGLWSTQNDVEKHLIHFGYWLLKTTRAPLTAKKVLEGATRTPQGLQRKETDHADFAKMSLRKRQALFECDLYSAPSELFDTAFEAGWLAHKHESLIPSPEPKSSVEVKNNESVSPTLTKGKEKSVWIRTAERAPTEKDADQWQNVLVSDPFEAKVTTCVPWYEVVKMEWPFWMPIPALPTKEEESL